METETLRLGEDAVSAREQAGTSPSQTPGSATSKVSTRSRNEKRAYRGLTCANCRARKVRCGGGQPSCKTCEVYNDKCRYDRVPPLSQVMAMAKRLQEAEETIARLRAQAEASPRVDARSSLSSPIPQIAPTAAPPSLSPFTPSAPSEPTVTAPPASVVPAREPATFRSVGPSVNTPTAYLEAPSQALPPDLSVDENGEIQYLGPTSAVHDPHKRKRVPATTQASSAATGDLSRRDVRSALMTYAEEAKIWEEFALGNASLQTGIPRQIIAKLLHIHWTWVSPMFMYVYRPAFVRDMATRGRYYSELLLTVICAHASKYQDSNYTEFLLARVRSLLGSAIQQPSSIPTVQALLQLSAYELARGSISQAWVYSGIAFRMASDLGLQHSDAGIHGLGPVDVELRKRLFWSCYFWDKATSLYTGRLPAVTELPQESSLDLLDDSMELERWTPYYGDSVNLAKFAQTPYPPSTSHAVSCFSNSCKLSIIINDIIVQLYSRRSRAITESALRDIRTRLDDWRTASPAHLRYDPDALPSVSPPPHIVSQNLLYYTTVILAHRPFWSVAAYYQVCITAAQNIEKLLLLLESTFGLNHITYLMGYCIYTGASVVLEDAKRSNLGTEHPVLRTFLRALNAGTRRCPLLERSINIIVRGLSRTSSDQPNAPPDSSAASCHLGGGPQTAPDASGTHLNPYIPAFPYFEPSSPQDFNPETYLGGVNAFGFLDCFPEMQLDPGGDFGSSIMGA